SSGRMDREKVPVPSRTDPSGRRLPVRRLFLRAAAGLGVGLALLAAWYPAGAKDPPAPGEGATCTAKAHGTSVVFYDTPSEAATVAKKEQKLVMVLHISGNFENKDYT